MRTSARKHFGDDGQVFVEISFQFSNAVNPLWTGEKDDQINLQNLTLPRILINRTGLSHVSFAGSDLYESFMCRDDFENCDFTLANLSKCDMRASRFVKCKFRNANLQGADFRMAELTGCEFSDANMTGTIFDDTITYKSLLNKLSDSQKRVICWAPHAGPEPPGG